MNLVGLGLNIADRIGLGSTMLNLKGAPFRLRNRVNPDSEDLNIAELIGLGSKASLKSETYLTCRTRHGGRTRLEHR